MLFVKSWLGLIECRLVIGRGGFSGSEFEFVTLSFCVKCAR